MSMTGTYGIGILRRRKRKFGKTKALFATDGEWKATATWEKKLETGNWECITASKHLRWMVGMGGAEALQRLGEAGLEWNWIPKLF